VKIPMIAKPKLPIFNNLSGIENNKCKYMSYSILEITWNEIEFYSILMLGTALVVIPAVVSFFSDRKKKLDEAAGRKVKLQKEIILLIVGLTGAALFFIQGKASHKESVENQIKADSNNSLYQSLLLKNKNEVSALKDSIIDLSKSSKTESDRLRDSLVVAKNQIISDGLETKKNILGYGYCILQLVSGASKNEYNAMLYNRGKYSIYDISVITMDYDSVKDCLLGKRNDTLFLDQNCFYKHAQYIREAEVEPNAQKYISYNIFTSSTYKKIEFKIGSRSSVIVEQAIFQMTKGVCPVSYKIFKLTGETFKLVESYNGISDFKVNWNEEFYQINKRALGVRT
jgi:hypothetical protein